LSDGTGYIVYMRRRLPEYLFAAITLAAITFSILCKETSSAVDQEAAAITIFLCGDVMTGRGIDQILPHPSDPVIYESYMKSAKGYVDIAERTTGRIPYPVPFTYIWGDALGVWERLQPDVKIINLETSITESGDYWKNKGINYRMHPENAACLTSAGIDFCSLANNHVLDWGYAGLGETMKTLADADIQYAGAGMNSREAESPAIFNIEGKGRVLVFSYGCLNSGIPLSWSAGTGRAGVNLLSDLSERSWKRVRENILRYREQGDIVLVSIHWGGNWGYKIPAEQVRFAHELIDNAGVDIIHAHSSHHVKGIEIYNGKPVLYGCGDFLNDYEGISGHEAYRNDLSLMYFISMDPETGKLLSMQLIPTRIRNFSISQAEKADARWLQGVLNRESKRFGTGIDLQEDNSLLVRLPN
jgi:poly-gamma-glutamate synthesis protein (capsule biosynthesis protein)